MDLQISHLNWKHTGKIILGDIIQPRQEYRLQSHYTITLARHGGQARHEVHAECPMLNNEVFVSDLGTLCLLPASMKTVTANLQAYKENKISDFSQLLTPYPLNSI